MEKERKEEASTTDTMFSDVMAKLEKLSKDLNDFGAVLENMELLIKEANAS